MISSRSDIMMDLTLEIQGDATSLEKCLDLFTRKERLVGNNMYKCDRCNDYVKAWKQLHIHQAPNILTIVLKRFRSGRNGKLKKKITFHQDLDLTPYMSERGDDIHLYTLYAVVVHIDVLNDSMCGHYVCYTKDYYGRWYRIDDDKIKIVKVEEVLSQYSYILLYSRRDARKEPSKTSKKQHVIKIARDTYEVIQNTRPKAKENVLPIKREKVGNTGNLNMDKLWPFFTRVIDVRGDGNCGYRVIALQIYKNDNLWTTVRQDLLGELRLHRAIYSDLFGANLLTELEKSLKWFTLGAFAPKQYWMTLPDMGLPIASCYNTALLSFSELGCLTYLPLFAPPPTKRREIGIIFLPERDHFVKVEMKNDCPTPKLYPLWEKYHAEEAINWIDRYIDGLRRFEEIMGDNMGTQKSLDRISLDDNTS